MNCPLLLLLISLVWLSFFLSYIKGIPGAERFVGAWKLPTLANLHNLLIQMVDHSQDITMLFLTREKPGHMSFGCDLRLGSLTSPDRLLVVQIVKIKTSFMTVSY